MTITHSKKISRILLSFLVLLTFIFSVPAVKSDAAKISSTAKTITVGQKTTLKVTGTSKKITWSSSKKSVATVNSKGVVTGKKVGTATITAKYGTKKLKCIITVKKAANWSGTYEVNYGVDGRNAPLYYTLKLKRVSGNTYKYYICRWRTAYIYSLSFGKATVSNNKLKIKITDGGNNTYTYYASRLSSGKMRFASTILPKVSSSKLEQWYPVSW